MKRIVFVVLLSIMANLNAQTYEIGIFAGGANFIGDVGRMNYVSPNSIAYGGLFKWNASTRYSWRAGITTTKLSGDDADSDIASRQQRGYEFESNIIEFSGGIEVNFVKFNLHKMRPAFSPYLYTGVTYFLYDEKYFNNGNSLLIGENKGAFSVPMVVGLKKNISRKFVLGLEVGARYTFTDSLDGSNPREGDSSFDQYRLGNIYSDDWYVFSGVTFTYAFGRKPCYDCVD